MFGFLFVFQHVFQHVGVKWMPSYVYLLTTVLKPVGYLASDVMTKTN